MEPYIGVSFLPCASLVNHIFLEILCEELEAETLHDLKGKWPISIKIRSFPDKNDTIELVLLPEIFTEYLMDMHTISYKDAAKELYGGILPTTHHVNMLLNDIVLNSSSIKGKVGGVTIQIVEGNLSHQYTHAILNVTDPHLTNTNEVAASLVDAGGERISRACDTYIDENGPLNVGQIASLNSGNLRCYHLFCTVFPKSEKFMSEVNSVKSALSALVFEANTAGCKSISIPAMVYSQKVIKEVVTLITDIVRTNEGEIAQTVEIIRFVGKNKTALKLYSKAL